MTKSELRATERARKRRERLQETVVLIPPIEDRERRTLLESDDIEWLAWYFGDGCGLDEPFTYSFTWQQRRMIKAVRDAIVYSWDQAIAASRGEGKSTIAERLLIKCTLTGELNYAVLFASTAKLAKDRLDSIKNAIEFNDRLAADYPEVCIPVRDLEGTPNKANSQHINGDRFDNGERYEMAETRFSWCGEEITFPHVPGAPSSGAIIATRGLEAAVRGLNKRGRRPQLAIIDDPDTTDTATSDEQAGKLEKRINNEIGGLGRQRRTIGRLVLTTIPSRTSVSFRLTSMPTWRPERFRFLITPPERMDLWQEYMDIRRAELSERDASGDLLNPHARRSHEFLLDHLEDMNRGAEAANPNRFDNTKCPDGSCKEISALQHYFNQWCDKNEAFVRSEFDNNPLDESGPVTSGITPILIQRKLSGKPRKVIPLGCIAITQGIDIGKWWLYWVVRAWKSDGTGYTIDYERERVHDPAAPGEEGLDLSVRTAILTRIEESRGAYAMEDGSEIGGMLTLIDARYRTEAVKTACLQAGLGVYPIMGHGKSRGCVTTSYLHPRKKTQSIKAIGDNWYMAQSGNVRVIHCYADHWKAWEHDRWLTSSDKPGAMMIFGQSDDRSKMSKEEYQHAMYSDQICSELELEEPFKGGIRRVWKLVNKQNHYLDASCYSDVAANMKDVRLTGPLTAKPPTTIPGIEAPITSKPPTAQELANKAKHYSARRR